MALNAGSIEIKLFASIAKLQNDMDKASKHIDSFSKRTEATLQRTGNAFKGLFAGVTINTIARLADEYKKFDAQLKLATNTVEDYNKAYANVIRIGRVSMSDIGAIGVLYARLTNNLKDYGTTQKEISDITESVSLALRVSNATVQETNSVMLQLSQSFGSGRINGQEFLAVMEGAPILMRQLAKSIGVPYGALKDLSAQGKITADLLKKAWTDPEFLNLLRQQVKEVGTISSAYTVFVNNLKQFIGEADKATGATTLITQGIMLVADNINMLANIAIVALIASVGKWVASTYASIKASQLRQIELVKETVLIERKAAAEARAAAVTAAAQSAALANNAKATTMWAAKNAGAFTENAAVMATVAQRTTVAAKAMGAFRNAIALLGGPIGAIITAIGVLALGFMKLKDSIEQKTLPALSKYKNEIKEIIALENTRKELNLSKDDPLAGDKKALKEAQTTLETLKEQRRFMESLGGVYSKEQKREKDIEIQVLQNAVTEQSLGLIQKENDLRKQGFFVLKEVSDAEKAAAADRLAEFSTQSDLRKKYIKDLNQIIQDSITLKLSDEERNAKIAILTEKYNKATGAAKALKDEETAAARAAKEAAADQLRWFEERQEASDRWIQAQKESRQAQIDSILESNQALQDQIDETNKAIEIALNGEEGYRRLEIARLNDALATAEQTVAQGKLNGLSGEALTYAENYIEYLREQIRLKNELNEREAIERNFEKVAEAERKAAADKLKEDLKDQKSLAKDLGMTFTSAFEDAMVAGKGLSEVLKGLAQDIQRIILRKTITEPLGGAVGDFINGIDFGGLFGFANGGIMTSKGALPLNKYANGGVATGPQMALFGEGRMNEAYVPLPDGRNIPVKLQGQGSAGTTINQTINIDARGADAGVEAKIRQAVADGAKQGYALVINDLSRGGPVARLTGAAS